MYFLAQGSSIKVLESPAQFGDFPVLTCQVNLVINKLQVESGVFEQGNSKTVLDSGLPGPELMAPLEESLANVAVKLSRGSQP